MTTTPTMTAQLHALHGLSTTQLRAKYRDLFGEDTTSHNRDFLFKRIAWRLQEQAYGGLSQRAQTRLASLVDESLIRVRPPQDFQPAMDAGPAPAPPNTGNIIARVYSGQHPRRGDASLPQPVGKHPQGHAEEGTRQSGDARSVEPAHPAEDGARSPLWAL